MTLAQHVQAAALLVRAHYALGTSLSYLGQYSVSQTHLEQAMTLYGPLQRRSRALLYGQDLGVLARGYAAWNLWALGYPDQALQRSLEALALARELAHPFSLVFAQVFVALLHQVRREAQAAQVQAEGAITLAAEQGFGFWLALGRHLQGWALTEQGQYTEGVAQMRQSITAYRATGAESGVSLQLLTLAEVCGKAGQGEEGLHVLNEALAAVHKNEERYCEAELWRVKGTLTLQQEARDWRLETSPPSPPASSLQPQVSAEVAREAEGYFLQAVEVARQQEAKSWELRTVMSLARLWQRQGKKAEARQRLTEIYGWFTEGFDTADLREAKRLLAELS